MSIRRSVLALTLALLLPSPLFSAPGDPVLWRDSIRDVYLDGTLDRRAQVLVSDDPALVAVLSARLPRAIVFDRDGSSLHEADRSAFALAPDRLTAETNELRLRKSGTVSVTPDRIYTAELGRRSRVRTLMVKPHVSAAGPIDLESFRQDYPVWAAVAGAYEPAAEKIAALAGIDRPTTFRVVFATWCGDSRRYVPQLLKAIDRAANPNLSVELVGIGPDFHTPIDFIAENRILNVPTVLVEQDGSEIGRLVETPATESVEGDLVAILGGTLPRHPGRWERDHLVASGTYRLHFASGEEGTETWKVFATPTGGKLVHSIVVRQGREREIWQTFDPAGRTIFAEVTDRTAGESRRTRYRPQAARLTAHSRGNARGIIDQVVALPEDCGFVTGSIVAAAWSCGAAPDEPSSRVVAVYEIGGDPGCPAGSVGTIRVTSGAAGVVDFAGEQRPAWPLLEEIGARSSMAWIDARLGIPLRRNDGAVDAVLVDLVVAGS